MGGITLRELDAKQITETVAQLCKEAAYYLPKDVYEGLKKGRETEKSPVGQAVLDQIIKNAEIARDEDRPYCQDTGMTIVFLEVGQDLHIVGGDLEEAVNDGIAKGYTEGYLRKSVVAEPIFNRVNTQNNTPGVIYTKIVPGDKLKITVEPKGFGSENKGGIKMLVPADGLEGVKLVEQIKPDIVLLDLDMPTMSGNEALAQILEIDPTMKVLMLTVSEDGDDLAECMRLGAVGYLLKKIDADFLLQSIRHAVAGDSVISPEMTSKLVMKLRNDSFRTSSATADIESLTPRERQTLAWLARGVSNKEIARTLDLAESTVKVHVQSVLRKLNIKSRVQAAVFAVEHHLDKL